MRMLFAMVCTKHNGHTMCFCQVVWINLRCLLFHYQEGNFYTYDDDNATLSDDVSRKGIEKETVCTFCERSCLVDGAKVY